MLIISKDHDYYDTIGKSTGIDKSIVYNRKREEFERGSFYRWDRMPPDKISCLEPLLIGFCGRTYHGLKVHYRENYYRETKPYSRFFYGEEAQKMYDKLSPSNAWFYKHTGRKRWWEQQFDLEVFRKHHAPILLRQDTVFIINPVLREINFQSQVDPYTAFQEIQMFISGVLGKSEKEVVEVSDQDRLEGHGFDKKWSFRQPENRKPRKRKKK